MIEYKITLKRLSKNQHFKWFFTYNLHEDSTDIKLYFQFKGQEPVLAMDLSRACVVFKEDAKGLAEMYLKSEHLYNGDKLVWIERITSYGDK